MTDPAYSEGMERLMALAMAVEFDLRTMALDFHMASRQKSPEKIHEAVVESASVDVAWRELLAEMGISCHEMSDAAPPRHPSVKVILRLGEGEESAGIVQALLEAMRANLAA